ncbi:MAG: hypothetical protein N2643_00305 [Endomicrobia bacterium]|nr:hypothetical protein [Endomicrobiia bacterium]
MKPEETLAKNLAYMVFKKINGQKDKNVKKIVFCIEGNLILDKECLRKNLKECMQNTNCEKANIEFLYKYEIGSEQENVKQNIYLHEIVFEKASSESS